MLKPLPTEFLARIAREYGLTSPQEAAFVARYSASDEVDDEDVAKGLNIARTTFATRMTGVYDKFSIAGSGSGKFYKLWAFLADLCQKGGTISLEDAKDIDSLVKQIRSKLDHSIRQRCGMMQVLDMEQPIDLLGIYTNVNILEKQSRLRSERELLADCDFDNRLVRERRIPGLAAVEKHRRLMVLGKPGAGKTTFLKYLAMQCITGGFAADQVPFFVTLKDFAEAEKSPSLVQYLADRLPNLQNPPSERGGMGITNYSIVYQLLLSGRSLILLDGLDEVREEDTARVIREMRDTADRLGDSQFVITCRIAAKEYTFERFTEVEVADFGKPEIATFARNWFRAKNDLPKAKTFVQRLERNQPIQELATNPLLLTLLCLVFGDGGDFPSNRADLYEEGVKILLRRWDAKRNIQRNELYKRLDVQRREDLLSYVALQTFQQKEYFIKQRRLEGYIADFIGNLRDVDPEPEALRIDSALVLRSIQAQHGLLVERARGIYSFSHLTFHEYFAARDIAATNQVNFLVDRIQERRWREVILLTVGMMRNADALLLAMKSCIDLRLSQDEKLQQFLQWVNQKSSSVEVPYRASAVRAFYLDHACASDHIRSRNLVRDLDLDLDLDLALVLERSLGALNRARDRDRDPALDRALDIVLDIALDRALILDTVLARDRVIDRVIDRDQDPDLKCKLQELFNRLPNTSNKDRENFNKWWKTNGQRWTEDLRQIMITHRNIGHDWQFTDDQKALLQQYYDANLLLVECLNSDGCYVDRSVREEIEATLLLPVEEIEKREKIEN
jgi:predicted NACHT family NTPase